MYVCMWCVCVCVFTRCHSVNGENKLLVTYELVEFEK